MEPSRDDFVIALRSAFLKKSNQQRFSLLSLILFSIIFLVMGNFNFKIIDFNRSVIKEVIYFSSFIVSAPEKTIKKSYNKITTHFTYYDDYREVKNALQKLKSKDLSKKIIKYENIELKKLIEDYFVENSQVYAKVLMDKESPFLRSIVINKGSKSGVRVGMIVYDDIYLIGRVVEVNYLTSRVLLISDINSKVPVTILPLNIEAIMSGLDKQNGKLQYINVEKLNNTDNEELIVVTSGSGEFFKSGIPIGKIDSINIQDNNKIVVSFYRDFSQLKYVKILSYKKEEKQLDQANKNIFERSNNQISTLNSQKKDIKVFKKQVLLAEEIRKKLEEENFILNKKFVNIKKQLDEEVKKASHNKIKNTDIKFLELNLVHGHKCRRTFLKSKLYKIDTPEYRECVFSKDIKKN